MRCLTLAELLRRHGVQAVFVCRPMPGHLCEQLEKKGFRVLRLREAAAGPASADPASWLGASVAEDAAETAAALATLGMQPDWLVVDNYALDAAWERALRPRVRHIMVIDDLANRVHECDLLLDQNYYQDLEHRYDGLVPAQCEKLLGPQYVLLRQEFLDARPMAKPRSGKVGRLLVFLGGSDPENFTGRALQAITQANARDLQVDAVVGASNVHHEEIRKACLDLRNASFHRQVNNMAALMLQADLAIGAGGSTTWERCLLGLPALTLVIAQNQLQTTRDLSAIGLAWYLGRAQELSAADIAAALCNALADPARLRDMSARSIQFMAGAGTPALNSMLEKLFKVTHA